MVGLSAAGIARELGGGRERPIAGGFRVPCVLSWEHKNDDRDPSMTVTEPDDKVLVRCWSRHSNEQGRITQALTDRGLWYEANSQPTTDVKLTELLSQESECISSVRFRSAGAMECQACEHSRRHAPYSCAMRGNWFPGDDLARR
jgi:hypothetical protein